MLYDLLDFYAQISALNAIVRIAQKSVHAAINVVVQFSSISVQKTTVRLYRFLPRKACQGTATFCTTSLEKCASKLQIFCSSISVLTCSTASLKFEPKLLYGLSRKSCPKYAFHCVLTQLYGLAEMLPWNVCQAATSFSSLSRNLPCSLTLLLSICS